MLGITSDNINSLHNNVARVVREVTGTHLQIVSTSHRKDWESARKGSVVSFEFEPHPEHPTFALTDYIERNRGRRTFVFCLITQEQEDPTLWASWYEEWKVDSQQDDRFDLIALSWTFYWGVYNRHRTNIIRADWDALYVRSQGAAQPHWHVDPSLLVNSYTRIRRAPDIDAADDTLLELPHDYGGLEEIGQAPTGLQEVSLGGMHLGMGGWNHPGEHPSCWRRNLPTAWQEITEWVRKTLEYATDQFIEHVHPDAPVEM